MGLRLPPRVMLLGLGLTCAASVGLALLAQHRFGMLPCPWCILQRMIFVMLAVLCLVAAILPHPARRAASALGLVLAAGGAAAALWQHFVAARTSSCAMSWADQVISATTLDVRFPDWFEVQATCADAAASVLGVPFEFWSLALFAICGLALLVSALTPGRRA
jgi:disulfide bond formation protein DsbB